MLKLFVLILMGVFYLTSFVYAGKLFNPQPNRKIISMKRRDIVSEKQDTIVDNKATVEKKTSPAWKSSGSQVNTWLERKYDRNYDNHLQPQEVLRLLRDRHKRLIKILQKRNPPVDRSSVESYYDFDKNGVFDKQELSLMKEDIL